MGLDRLLPLPKPQVQRRIIFSASVRKGEGNATDVSELPRQSPALKSVYTDRKAVLSLHTYICIKSSVAFSLCVFALLQKESTNSYKSNFIKMPTLVTLSTLNFIHFLLVYFGLLVCPTQCLESNLSLKSLGKPYIFRRLKAKKQNQIGV